MVGGRKLLQGVCCDWGGLSWHGRMRSSCPIGLMSHFWSTHFMGLDRGRQTGVLGFFIPKNHSDTHPELAPYGRHLLSFLNSRTPVHKDP